jgi:2-dehydropantoate 2-reductase
MTPDTPAAPGPSWPRIVVFGAGAVGCWYGARLALAGAPVVLVARPAHVEAIAARGLWVDSGGERTVVPVRADATPEPVRDADLVLLCVKSSDTAEAARAIAARLPPCAAVVSMQNGVDNVARLRAAAPGLDAYAAVVYVGASMAGPGHVVHAGRGDLVLGAVPGGTQPAARVPEVARLFERAGVRCRPSDDVRAELWAKLVMNATFNAISALTRGRYGPIVADPGLAATARELVAECVAVARADGVPMAEVDALHAAALELGRAMSGATSSTEQDLALGRPTEIDALNGYVVARGDALGVPVPMNRAMHALVRMLERERAARPR